MDTQIGDRIRPLLAQSGISQNQLASDVDMARDALSRAMTGKRGFSSIEVAAIAERLNVSVRWLITGRPDPNAMTSAARCAYNFDQGTYSNPGQDNDRLTLDNIQLAYTQAWPNGAPASKAVPQDPAQARTDLGDGFVRNLSEQIENVYDVDVVRTAEVSTDYALTIGDRCVMVIASTDRWFRENWSLAHELGHVAHGHAHGTAEDRARTEPAANAFAADLLLPEAQVRAVDWTQIDAPALGALLWEWGVSTEAVRHRLSTMHVVTSSAVDSWLSESTLAFLKQRALPASQWRDLVDRQRAATARRFPTDLILSHETAIASGRLTKATLAWMLGVDPAKVSAPEHLDGETLDLDELAAELGLSRA